ncbi:MAG: C40 family peptidase [Marmoricola sp.]
MSTHLRAALVGTVALASVIGLGGLGVGGLGGAAVADDHPYPSKQQVDRAQADVTARRNDLADVRNALAQATASAQAAAQQAEVAAEAYNGAMWRLSVARRQARAARAAADRAHQRVIAQREGIAQLVVTGYQDGTSFNGITAVLGADGPGNLVTRINVAAMAGRSMENDFERYRALSDEADAAKKDAAAAAVHQNAEAAHARAARAAAGSAARAAAASAAHLASQRDAVVAALATAQHTSVALARQRQSALEAIARRKAAEEARRKAAAQAAAAARAARIEAQRQAAEAARQRKEAEAQAAQPTGADVAPLPPAPVPLDPNASGPGASAVQKAIAFAEAQLGEPYVWAGAGPHIWDCSGLTMKAWAAAGIALPHYAAAQYDLGTPVPVTSAKPGDLLFWSNNGQPSGIHHVALYLGDGRFIEAPHTGAYVRYNSIYNWWPDFAVRL